MPTAQRFPTAMQRLGVGCELPGLIAERNVDPGPLFAEVGIDLAAVGPDLRMAFPQLLHLLHRAVQVTGCCHLGLLCGLRFDLRHHGRIGDLMKTAPTLWQAMEDFVTWQPGYSSGAIVYLHQSGPDHAVGYGLYTQTTPGAAILYDVVVGVGLRLVRLLTEGAVTPVEVHLSRSAPQTASAYGRLLQATVRFDQNRTCLVFDAGAMATKLPGANDTKRREALDQIRSLGRWSSLSVSDRVRHEVRRALLSGPPRMPGVADALCLDARTLRRKLRAESTSFKALSDEVRMTVAQELLALTNLSISEIASATGTASTSVFSESFRRWTGTTATQARRARSGP